MYAPRILEGGVNFTPRPLYPWRKSHGTHWIGGWVGLTAGLDTMEKRKIPSPHRQSNPLTAIVQPVASRYIDVISSFVVCSKCVCYLHIVLPQLGMRKSSADVNPNAMRTPVRVYDILSRLIIGDAVPMCRCISKKRVQSGCLIAVTGFELIAWSTVLLQKLTVS
jgi:hypothetical protein